MAKPSHTDAAALDIAARLRELAPFARPAYAGRVEIAAFELAFEGATLLSRWRRDTTETNRRRAHAAAASAGALVAVALSGEGVRPSPFARAVEALALATVRTCEGDALGAINLASGACAPTLEAARYRAPAFA